MPASYQAKEYYQQETVAAAYDRERFGGLRGVLVDWLERRLLVKSLAGLPAGARVLDLPVGTGRMSRYLTGAGYRMVGADVSAPMLGVARRLGGRAGRSDLLRCDAEGLPFAAKSLDAAICLRLMSHLPREARVAILSEMARVVVDRVVAVYQPHRLAAWWLLNGLVLRRRLPLHFVPPDELEGEFARCGLRIVRSHSLLRGVFMERAYVLAPSASG